jgi:phage-related protein
MPPHARPFKDVGSGVFEIRKAYDTNTYRIVYAVRIDENIYILHAFQKKAKKGIATPKKEVDLIRKRYKEAIQLEQQKKGGRKQ